MQPLMYSIYVYVSMVREPAGGRDLLVVEALRSLLGWAQYTRYDSSGRVNMPTRTTVPDNSTTLTRADVSLRRDLNPQFQEENGRRPTP